MVFSSLTFICVFLPIVFLGHLLIPSIKAKNILLIFASLLFYAYGEPVYVLLMIASSVMNYLFGRILGFQKTRLNEADGNRKTGKNQKIVVALAVILNLAFLGVFKYADMFILTADALWGLSWNVLGLALPIGISFYTFQAMSYVIDVYRGDVEASKSFSSVLLYISFFPQLIAGPIIKYHDVEKQLKRRKVTVVGIASGLRRFSVGLAKKVLIANTMAGVVDTIYAADFGEINVVVAWIAALAYIMQIYFDFSGYSDMAIGLAKMFGFYYKENFNYPYISTSIKEFWRRWHISLSTWLKEYLYIPLGGNRKGKLRASLNKIVVFFCCGLWHGASWTFALRGLFHGLFLMLEEYLPIKKLPRVFGHLYALLVITVGFVIFRAETIDQGLFFISQMFTGFHFEQACTSLALLQLTPLFILTFVIALFACLPIVEWIQRALAKWDMRVFEKKKNGKPEQDEMVLQPIYQVPPSALTQILRFIAYGASLALIVLCLLSLSSGGYNPFIYFRF